MNLLIRIVQEVDLMIKIKKSNAFLNELDQQRIRFLELHVKILKDHLKRYGEASGKDAVSYLEGQIDLYEREVRIRKDFPNIKTSEK